MKPFLLFLFLTLASPLFAQEPGMVIQITIKNPHLIKGDECGEYQVNILGIHMYARNPKEYGGIFIFSDGSPYRPNTEVWFEVIHKGEKMEVVFTMDNIDNNTKYDYIFFSRFEFEIPFSPGCYRINQFSEKETTYSLLPNTNWNDLKCDTCCKKE